MDKLKELEQQYRSKKAEYEKIAKEFLSIEHKYESAKMKPKLQSCVGKFYKYRNSFGGGDRWWLYYNVTGIKGKALIGNMFQTNSYGDSDFKRQIVSVDFIDTYKEITEAEYKRALKAFKNRLDKIIEATPFTSKTIKNLYGTTNM